MNKDKSKVQQKADQIKTLLGDIEPILNAHGYSWGTVFGEGADCYSIYIMPKNEESEK